MTRRSPSYLLGYHGCDRGTASAVLERGDRLLASDKAYDWLGPGTYFWENDPQRALEWAKNRVSQPGNAFVIGAIIDPGNCLDLTLRENLDLLEAGYTDLVNSGEELPENRDPKGVSGDDKLLRFLDCAVIRRVHSLIQMTKTEPFDSVRGLFPEGDPVYPGARFLKKTHTQIAVINPACVIEVFVPRVLVQDHGLRRSMKPPPRSPFRPGGRFRPPT